jgi:hypothetical protein
MKRTWFTLSRHEDPPADPAPADPASATEPPTPPEPPKDPATEVEKWKALSRKNEDRAKANEAAARELAAIKAAQQTETEKLQAEADAARKTAAEATARAVRSEVRALADGFADREDAVLNLGDLGQYVKDGEVDTAAIETALAAVLERKKHLAKPAGVRNPAPDPSQGKGGTSTPPDYRTADKAAFEAELAKYGLRPQST